MKVIFIFFKLKGYLHVPLQLLDSIWEPFINSKKKCRAKTCVKALMYCTNAFYFWTQEPQSIQLWVLKYVNYSSFSKFKIFWHETDLFVSENLQNIIQFSRGRLVIFYTEMMKKVSKNFPILEKNTFIATKYHCWTSILTHQIFTGAEEENKQKSQTRIEDDKVPYFS